MNDDRIIKTYVWYKDKCFFASTIERDSSAIGGPQRYNETLVWEYFWEKNERGKILYQGEDSKGSIHTHQKIVDLLYKTGRVEEDEKD